MHNITSANRLHFYSIKQLVWYITDYGSLQAAAGFIRYLGLDNGDFLKLV